MDYQILTDKDIYRLLDMKTIVEIIEETFRQKADGNLSHPPRVYVEGGDGSLAFTIGASPNQNQALGFRVYSMFKNTPQKNKHLTAVFDSKTGAFKGAVIGTAVGELRTGAIGGVAIKYLAPPDAQVLGIIGTGIQAVAQLQAAVAVHEFKEIQVYSRNKDNRVAFANRMSKELNKEIRAVDSVQSAVEPADVLICATISPEPVFDPAWLKASVHITTIGPKLIQNHELPVEVAKNAELNVTDSLAQIESFGEKHFMYPHLPLTQYVDLGDIVAGKHPGRTTPKGRTIFHSVGLAGTEVVVANHAFLLNKK